VPNSAFISSSGRLPSTKPRCMDFDDPMSPASLHDEPPTVRQASSISQD
jgi:hypothetical protein